MGEVALLAFLRIFAVNCQQPTLLVARRMNASVLKEDVGGVAQGGL